MSSNAIAVTVICAFWTYALGKALRPDLWVRDKLRGRR